MIQIERKHYHLLLYPFFEELRTQLQLPLGIDNYYDLLQVLAEEESPNSMRLVCKTLWLKSQRDKIAFENLFSKHLEDYKRKANQYFTEILKEKDNHEKNENKAPLTPKPINPNIPVEAPEEEENVQNEDTKQEDTEEKKQEELTEQQENIDDIQISIGENKENLAVTAQNEEDSESYQDISQHHFLLGKEYMPIQLRHLQQNWRLLRNHRNVEDTLEIDYTKTIQKIAKNGFFYEPVYQSEKQNIIKLLIAIDDSLSMAAFNSLATEIAENALNNPHLKDIQIFYFNNCPINHLFYNPYHTESIVIDELIGKCNQHTTMLIISDAGAARGFFTASRIKDTRNFLNRCKTKINHIAWVNPMPCNRWEDTSAEFIETFVPMFEINHIDWYKTINALRGKNK